MADIFNEVDEDLRREKLEQLWKKTAPYIISGVILFVGGVGGKVYWDQYTETSRIEQSERYQSALEVLGTGQESAALQAFNNIGQDGKYGYDLLADLQAASLLVQDGRVDESLSAYDVIAGNSDYQQEFRDFAALMAAMVVLDQTRYDEAAVRLAPLADGEGPWVFTAQELTGLMALEQENWELAEEMFRGLSLNLEAPTELQTRAGEYLRILDVKRPQTADISGETLDEAEESVAQEEGAGDPDQ